MEYQIRYRKARNITLIGALINLLLAIVKTIAGVTGHSAALFADGLHSFSDLLTDALVVFASRYGSRKADYNHPYGHGRIETAATAGLALLLIGVGIAILYDGIDKLLIHHTLAKPRAYAFFIAMLSIVMNEWLFHYTMRVGNLLKSKLLQANAWHHRSDAASSIVVLIGIAGAWFGYTYWDLLAALIIGVLIIKMGLRLTWSSLRELVDTGISEEKLARVKKVISAVPGVIAIHQLRTRMIGHEILVDVHILVQPRLTVSEGHHIAQNVHHKLIQAMEEISDVTVHIDVEDDEAEASIIHLPDRMELQALLHPRWCDLPGAREIIAINLHYLANKISIDLYLPLTLLDSAQSAQVIRQQYADAIKGLTIIDKIHVWYG